MKKSVSIIPPCYNGEKYISRLLDSVLNQTYKNIELIIINDGSIDGTEKIIFTYQKIFKDSGINLIYISQENKGQSSAINLAFPMIKGDFIAFVDSDDIMPDDAIEKKVDYMNSHPSVGLLVNKVMVLDFDTLTQVGTMERKPPKGKDHLFADLISGQNVFYTPGGYFWRTSMFVDAMPNPLQILSPREIGQNFQLIMPIAYKYPVGYIDEYLYYYLIRKGSHSRKKQTYQQLLHNWDIAKTVLTSIADDVESDRLKREHIQNLIEARYYIELMNIAYDHQNRVDFKRFRRLWIKTQVGNNKIKGYYIVTRMLIFRIFNKTRLYFARLIK